MRRRAQKFHNARGQRLRASFYARLGWRVSGVLLPLLALSSLLVAACSTDTAPASVAASIDPPADAVAVELVATIDGDTIRVRFPGGETELVRFIGIDTPETENSPSGEEPLAREATARTASLLSRGALYLERDTSDRDRFDRLLRYVWVQDGDDWILLNMVLVAEGLAEARAFPPDTARQAQLDDAERSARDQRLGIWAR